MYLHLDISDIVKLFASVEILGEFLKLSAHGKINLVWPPIGCIVLAPLDR